SSTHLLLLLSLLTPPPRSPLFPYTTLFRSRRRASRRAARAAARPGMAQVPRRVPRRRGRRRRLRADPAEGGAPGSGTGLPQRPRLASATLSRRRAGPVGDHSGGDAHGRDDV